MPNSCLWSGATYKIFIDDACYIYYIYLMTRIIGQHHIKANALTRAKNLMNPYCRVLTLIAMMSLLTADFSFSLEIRFRHLTIDDGLSQNAFFSIAQDSKGFMWFGTKDGLNRYDGYSFAVYQNNPLDSTTISANHITHLYKDRKGRL